MLHFMNARTYFDNTNQIIVKLSSTIYWKFDTPPHRGLKYLPVAANKVSNKLATLSSRALSTSIEGLTPFVFMLTDSGHFYTFVPVREPNIQLTFKPLKIQAFK